MKKKVPGIKRWTGMKISLKCTFKLEKYPSTSGLFWNPILHHSLGCRKELEKAVKKNMKYKFSHYMMICKTYRLPAAGKKKKPAEPGPPTFQNVEEEYFFDVSRLWWHFKGGQLRAPLIHYWYQVWKKKKTLGTRVWYWKKKDEVNSTMVIVRVQEFALA